MTNKNTSGQSYVSQTAQYTWVAAAFFIVTLILGAFAGIPRVEADSDSIQRGIDADAAQYQAMGESYLTKADDDLLAANPELMVARRSYRPATSLLAANPELMIARRSYRAMAGILAANPELMVARRSYRPATSLLATNPELMIARRSYHAMAGILAANPELMVARRWQAQSFNSLGSCSPADEATLAANPELMLVNREHGC